MFLHKSLATSVSDNDADHDIDFAKSAAGYFAATAVIKHTAQALRQYFG
jgi:hypothetical protein